MICEINQLVSRPTDILSVRFCLVLHCSPDPSKSFGNARTTASPSVGVLAKISISSSFLAVSPPGWLQRIQIINNSEHDKVSPAVLVRYTSTRIALLFLFLSRFDFLCCPRNRQKNGAIVKVRNPSYAPRVGAKSRHIPQHQFS